VYFVPHAAAQTAATDDLIQGYVLRFGGFVPSVTIKAMQPEMGRQVAVALYLVVMVAVIVGVDFTFFRSRFWERLIANIGIVLVFAAFYLRFFRRP